MRVGRLLSALLGVAVLAAASTGAAFAAPAGGGGDGDDGGGGGGGGGLNFDDTAELAAVDVEEFWAEEFPRVFDGPYEPVEEFFAYDSDSDVEDLSECFEGASYEDVANNASYCPLDDTIGYDQEPGNLVRQLYEENGPMGLALVIAHEWGHAIQGRLLTLDEFTTVPTIVLEQQADCFAGAWVQYLQRGQSGNLELDPGDVEAGLAGMLAIRDEPGGDPTSGSTHGNGFDRTNAFSEGLEQGADRCAEYLTGGLPVITEIPFTSEEDFEAGGNLSVADAIEFGIEDLDLYWATVFEASGLEYDGIQEGVEEFDPRRRRTMPECEGLDLNPKKPRDYEGAVFYCPGEEFIAYDENVIEDAHSEIGDFAAMILIANAWAAGMQEDLDLEGGSAQVDCFAGSYAGSVPIEIDGDGIPDLSANGNPLVRDFDNGLAVIQLSPGDLDEVVISFLRFSEPPTGEDPDEVTAYTRLQNFRQGFFEGEEVCAAITE